MELWDDYFRTDKKNTRYENTIHFNPPRNVFFSQYNQDKSLENCIFKGHKNGIFMDVGAHDGVNHSNTLYFEVNHDWKGINIEPIKSVYDCLVTNRPHSININCAVSDTNGKSQFSLNHGYTEMISGLVSHYDGRHLNRIRHENKHMNGHSEIVLMETRTIENICDEHNINHINYLSIDVEGAEYAVLKSVNYDKLFIDVIGFENNYPDTENIPIDFLKSKGYIKLPYHTADIFMIHKDSQFLENVQILDKPNN